MSNQVEAFPEVAAAEVDQLKAKLKAAQASIESTREILLSADSGLADLLLMLTSGDHVDMRQEGTPLVKAINEMCEVWEKISALNRENQ